MYKDMPIVAGDRCCNYNSAMDYEPRPGAERIVNMLRILNSHTVSAVIERANYELWQSLVTNADLKALTGKYQQELQRVIGENYAEERATVTGLAYTTDYRDNPTGSEVFFRRKKLIYSGPSVQAIANVPQLVFEFYVDDEAYDDDGRIIETVYYMLPEDMRELEIIPAEKLFDIISKHITQSRQQLSSDDFLQAPTGVQHDILASVLDAFNNDVQPYLDVLHDIEANRFMGTYDDMPMSFADSLVDKSILDVTHQFMLLGKYTGSVFPEISDQPDIGFSSVDDFYLSHGAPCMEFRDDDNRATYVIPIDAITKITTIEEFEET